jgi:hypothetical protein
LRLENPESSFNAFTMSSCRLAGNCWNERNRRKSAVLRVANPSHELPAHSQRNFCTNCCSAYYAGPSIFGRSKSRATKIEIYSHFLCSDATIRRCCPDCSAWNCTCSRRPATGGERKVSREVFGKFSWTYIRSFERWFAAAVVIGQIDVDVLGREEGRHARHIVFGVQGGRRVGQAGF